MARLLARLLGREAILDHSQAVPGLFVIPC